MEHSQQSAYRHWVKRSASRATQTLGQASQLAYVEATVTLCFKPVETILWIPTSTLKKAFLFADKTVSFVLSQANLLLMELNSARLLGSQCRSSKRQRSVW